MLLIKRTLLRAPAAVMQQLRGVQSLYDSVQGDDELPRVPAERKELQKTKPEDPTKLAFKDRCWMSMRRSEFKCRSDVEFNVDPFLDTQKRCLANPCATSYPPTDLTLYKPSDKLSRRYQRTWCECDVKQPKKKAVCHCRPMIYKRRPRPPVPKEAKKKCPKSGLNLGLGECLRKKLTTSCPKFKLPFCMEANKKGCYPGRPHSGCVRRRTKYPSYSECKVEPLPPIAPNHCTCVNQPPMCVVWNYYRMKKS